MGSAWTFSRNRVRTDGKYVANRKYRSFWKIIAGPYCFSRVWRLQSKRLGSREFDGTGRIGFFPPFRKSLAQLLPYLVLFGRPGTVKSGRLPTKVRECVSPIKRGRFLSERLATQSLRSLGTVGGIQPMEMRSPMVKCDAHRFSRHSDRTTPNR